MKTVTLKMTDGSRYRTRIEYRRWLAAYIDDSTYNVRYKKHIPEVYSGCMEHIEINLPDEIMTLFLLNFNPTFCACMCKI
jgi:hypothetical protein